MDPKLMINLRKLLTFPKTKGSSYRKISCFSNPLIRYNKTFHSSIYRANQHFYFSTVNAEIKSEPTEKKSIKLSQASPKSIKDYELSDLIQGLERYNVYKENLLQQLEKKEAANIINAIELRILKEIQLNKYPFTIKDYLAILDFFASHLSGSVGFFAELESQIPKLLESSSEHPLQANLRTVGKLIYASSKTNSFNRQYYEALSNAIKTLFDQCQDFSAQNLGDFIDSLYLLARKSSCDASTIQALGNKMMELDFPRISLEQMSNFVWTLVLKTNFDALCSKDLTLICEDIEYDNVSNLIKESYKHLSSLLTTTAMGNLNKLPFSLKFRLRQIALILEAIDPKASLTDPMIAALSSVEATRDHSNETSLIHDDVTAIIRAMNLRTVEREKKVLIYPCDLFLSPDLIIEVNGPSHYVGYNHQSQPENLDGRTLMKCKGLLMHKYRVRFISFREWYSIKGVTNKMNFISDKIYAKSL